LDALQLAARVQRQAELAERVEIGKGIRLVSMTKRRCAHELQDLVGEAACDFKPSQYSLRSSATTPVPQSLRKRVVGTKEGKRAAALAYCLMTAQC